VAHSANAPAAIPVTQPTPEPLFRGNIIRDFAISPDGRSLGVISPGRRSLSVYPLPGR
jgi:hypothetical protein